MVEPSDPGRQKTSAASPVQRVIDVAANPELVRGGGRAHSSMAAALTRWTYPADERQTARRFAAAARELGLPLSMTGEFQGALRYAARHLIVFKRTVEVPFTISQPFAGRISSTIAIKEPWTLSASVREAAARDVERIIEAMKRS